MHKTKHFVISDTHFGHTNIIYLRNRPFNSVGEMDECLIDNWNSVVKPGDLVFHLGDFVWDVSTLEQVLPKLNGIIKLCKGNHDWSDLTKVMVQHYSNKVVSIDLGISTRVGGLGRVWLSHYAHRTWPGKYHLYGHWHGLGCKPLPRSADMGVEVWNYTPQEIGSVLTYINNRDYEDATESSCTSMGQES